MIPYYSVVPVISADDQQLFTQTWYSIWLEQEYAVNSAIIEKYNRYNRHSNDFLLLNQNKLPVGTLRIITNNRSIGLPVLNDFEITETFISNICEATLLTVTQEEREKGSTAVLHLLIELWKFVRLKALTGILIAADIRLWYFLTRILRLQFKKIGKERRYEGSLTIPGCLNVLEQKSHSLTCPARNILEESFHTF